MRYFLATFITLFFLGIFIPAPFSYSDDVVITTYYPFPNAEYKKVWTTNNTQLAVNESGVIISNDQNTSLGTNEKLRVQDGDFVVAGGIYKATGGLVLESRGSGSSRTSEPNQVWLCQDC